MPERIRLDKLRRELEDDLPEAVRFSECPDILMRINFIADAVSDRLLNVWGYRPDKSQPDRITADELKFASLHYGDDDQDHPEEDGDPLVSYRKGADFPETIHKSCKIEVLDWPELIASFQMSLASTIITYWDEADHDAMRFCDLWIKKLHATAPKELQKNANLDLETALRERFDTYPNLAQDVVRWAIGIKEASEEGVTKPNPVLANFKNTPQKREAKNTDSDTGKRKPGRPKGSGVQYTKDESIVERAALLLTDSPDLMKKQALIDAAKQLGLTLTLADIDRLRRKLNQPPYRQ